VTWHWLKGHAGHPLNERADRLATEALRALRKPEPSPEVRPPANENLPAVDISVKSSCRGAKGPGGWGAVLRMGDHTKTISGRDPATTANAMLVRGATEALKAMSRPCSVTIYSDAKYLIQGGSIWVKGWQARGWQTRDGKPVANQEEWQALLDAARPHRVTWRLVQGEDVPEDLARAGELAGEASSLEKGDV
jgi:ribonuclease HI